MKGQFATSAELVQSFPNLPDISDQALQEALDQAIKRPMTSEDRQAQLVSFVWGNKLETDRGTMESVCRHLNINC